MINGRTDWNLRSNPIDLLTLKKNMINMLAKR